MNSAGATNVLGTTQEIYTEPLMINNCSIKLRKIGIECRRVLSARVKNSGMKFQP